MLRFNFEPRQVAHWRNVLRNAGWLYLPEFRLGPDGRAGALALARRFGEPAAQTETVVTAPSRRAPYGEPFNQLKAIGWHNDFSTRRVRPRWTMSFIEAEDPSGGGDWRVVEVRHLLSRLQDDSGVLAMLRRPLPFSVTKQGPPIWYQPLTRSGLRFYGRAIRDGCRLVHGEVPSAVRHLLRAVTRAADECAVTLRARKGSLLVVDNWRAMHDRLPQAPRTRRAVLVFVKSVSAQGS